MAHISIHREHLMTLKEARNIAESVAVSLASEYEMEYAWKRNELAFHRSGVDGTLTVSSRFIDIEIELGFLFGAFRGRIESEVEANLDKLLRPAKSRPAKKTGKTARG